MDKILDDIKAERQFQKAVHTDDDRHDLTTWVAIFADHLGKLARAFWSGNDDRVRQQAVRLGAISVALIEWCDKRKGRGTDDDR